MTRSLALFWASPNTMLGLLLGGFMLLTGGQAQLRSGILEFHGGALRWLFYRLSDHAILAMTLGHVVVGTCPAALDIAREHELVHVRQYERWGPLFLPAYGICSMIAWWRGERPYRDNWFERAAYDADERRERQRGGE